MKKEISCGIVVLQRLQEAFKVLVIKQASGKHWTLCKGHIESTDTSNLETAKRELLEEVNLTVNEFLFDQETFTSNYMFERNGHTVDKTNIFFVGIVEDPSNVRVQESEILDYKWSNMKEAIDIMTYDTDKEILRDVFQRLEK